MNDSTHEYQSKIEALEGLHSQFSADPRDQFHRMFFAARNGAISHVLRQFEHHFRALGMDVRTQWKESSFPGAAIELVLHDKRGGEHQRMVRIKREKQTASSDLSSELMYSLDTIQSSEYYARRKPKAAEDFDTVLASVDFQSAAAALVNGVNFPFTCATHSSF